MKVKLINVGRGKINTTVEVSNPDEILLEVSKHLMSQDIYVKWQTKTKGEIVVGGFRKVGEVEIL